MRSCVLRVDKSVLVYRHVFKLPDALGKSYFVLCLAEQQPGAPVLFAQVLVAGAVYDLQALPKFSEKGVCAPGTVFLVQDDEVAQSFAF